MKFAWIAASLFAISGCAVINVSEETVRNETPDCDGPMPMATNGQLTVTPVASHAIGDIPGKTLTSVLLTVPPGSKSNAHRHAGVVYGYVIEGTVCSQITGDAGLVPYHAGQSFFEPPGSHHLAFTNPGIITAKVLVTQVADTGATLTMPVQ
ncbi:MAG TPA: cupin domain-containing protein [Hyphomonadaceae bacterium]|nr:cupin domain-containing protein [Hyphomonadaceae bacterium]